MFEPLAGECCGGPSSGRDQQAIADGAPQFTLAHNVAARSERGRIAGASCGNQATVVRTPTSREWGVYSGYFADPDGFSLGRCATATRARSGSPGFFDESASRCSEEDAGWVA